MIIITPIHGSHGVKSMATGQVGGGGVVNVFIFGLEEVNQLKCYHSSQFSLTVCQGNSQQTRDVHPMLVQCWPTVCDAGPALYQHWVNVSCLLGCSLTKCMGNP